MNTIFSDMSLDELMGLYPDYMQLCETGMLSSDCKLGQIRDIYCSNDMASGLLTMELHYLKTIADKCYNKHNKR